MKISNLLRDEDRHYLSNLLTSGAGEIPDEDGKVSEKATHRFVIENGFIVAAEKVIRGGDTHATTKRTKGKN